VVSRAYVGGVWAHTTDEVYARYRPRFCDERWFVAAREQLIGWARSVNAATPTAAYKNTMYVCQFARFAHKHDIPLEPEVLFTPENVEWYVQTELTEHGEHSRSTQRGSLRLVGRTITRRVAWPPPETRFPKPAAAEPYSSLEQHRLISLADIQATERRRRACRGAVRLGLGGGFRGPELERITGADVEQRDDLVMVHVRGDRERTVPIRREHAHDVLELAFEHPEEPLLGPFKPHQRDPFSRIKALLEIPSWAPPLEVRRLRATWMVSVLNEDIQLATFVDVAGVTDFRFTHLLPHLHRKDTSEVARALAGHTA
jgi:hypothetical protein